MMGLVDQALSVEQIAQCLVRLATAIGVGPFVLWKSLSSEWCWSTVAARLVSRCSTRRRGVE